MGKILGKSHKKLQLTQNYFAKLINYDKINPLNGGFYAKQN